MSRQDANAAFALSSFLQGTNATYIDELYARYEQDPASVDAEWQEFFKSLKDAPADVRKNAEGPSWGRDHWPLTPTWWRQPSLILAWGGTLALRRPASSSTVKERVTTVGSRRTWSPARRHRTRSSR